MKKASKKLYFALFIRPALDRLQKCSISVRTLNAGSFFSARLHFTNYHQMRRSLLTKTSMIQLKVVQFSIKFCGFQISSKYAKLCFSAEVSNALITGKNFPELNLEKWEVTRSVVSETTACGQTYELEGSVYVTQSEC